MIAEFINVYRSGAISSDYGGYTAALATYEPLTTWMLRLFMASREWIPLTAGISVGTGITLRLGRLATDFRGC